MTSYDVIVIGSGAGGGTLHRLASSCQRSCSCSCDQMATGAFKQSGR